jgi:hypothetical protein
LINLLGTVWIPAFAGMTGKCGIFQQRAKASAATAAALREKLRILRSIILLGRGGGGELVVLPVVLPPLLVAPDRWH